jgi:hypothetical protein
MILRALARLFHWLLQPFTFGETRGKAVMATNDFIRESERQTLEAREQVFVGFSGDNRSEALDNAWEYAKLEYARNGTKPAGRLRAHILAEWAIAENPFTGYAVMIRLTPDS